VEVFMVHEETVRGVYTDLKALQDELISNRENPHMIRIVKNLLKLTNLGEDIEAAPEDGAAKGGPELVPAKVTPENCEHRLVNVFGQCPECGKCIHSQVRDGVCLTCGETQDSKSA
jgi:hypothetical protein